jgi:TetR/AcrR family transcriptional repressor of nem operon
MLVEPSTLTGAPELENGQRRGCLLGNTAAQLLPGDAEATALVAAAYDAVVEVLTGALARAQAAGEVDTSTSPTAQAQLLLLLFQGSALVGRAHHDAGHYAAGIDAALDALRAR